MKKITTNGELTYFTVNRDDDVFVRVMGIEDGEVFIVDAPIRDYLFIDKDISQSVKDKIKSLGGIFVNVDMRTGDEYKKPVVKVELSEPSANEYVSRLAKLHNVGVYEDGISFTRRLFIDEIAQVKYRDFVFFDIETDSSFGFPKEYGKYPFLSISVWASDGSWSDWFYIKDYDSEQDMLRDFIALLQKKKISFVVGWNVDFDYFHTKERLKYFGMYDEMRYWRLVSRLDLMEQYKKARPGLGSYSLHNVSIEEGFSRIKEMTKLPHEMTRQELYEYNMYDSEILQLINDRYQLVDVAKEVAHYVNLPMSAAQSTVARLETKMFRRLHELGYVGVRRNVNVGDVDYQGAIVLDPVPGVHKNVIVIDFRSLYPTTIINKNIDIRGFNGEVFPYVVKEALDNRLKHKLKWKEYEKKAEECKEGGDDECAKEYERLAFIEKLKSDALKIVVNGYYGANANKYYYFFDPDVAAAITAGGREMLMKTKKYLEDVWKFQIIYGDTDSLFVKVDDAFKGKDVDKHEIEEFAEIIAADVNEYVKPWVVDVDKLIRRIIFLSDKKGRGIKKRYAYVDFDGKIKIKGLEVVKGDWPKLTKWLQMEILKKILLEDASRKDIMLFVKDVKRRMYNGEFDEWLIITKNLSREVHEYDQGRKLPPHVTAYIKAEQRGTPFATRQVSFVWTVGKERGVPEPEPVVRVSDVKKYRLDYDYYWEHVIYPPAKRVIDSVYPVNMSILNWIK